MNRELVNPGTVFLVGAGPGDPGLLTLKGRECLEKADVVVYDHLANPELLAYAKGDAEVVYAGKKAGNHAVSQDDTNALLIARARAGKTVVRLKGGDPFVFGRGGEEAEELAAAAVPFEIVPGISSVTAGPAYAGIPVTHRAFNTQLTIFTGHEDPAKAASSINFRQLAETPGTKVMLMGVERIRSICAGLLAAGAASSTPIALIRWATTSRQETLTGTLGSIADQVERAGFKPPAVAVIGEVVSLRERLTWFETRPLFRRRIVVTRTRKQAGQLSRSLRALGADVLEIPTIKIEPAPNPAVFAELIADAHRYDWLIFTSPNGVERFFEGFFHCFSDVRSIGGVKIAALGSGTAAKIRQHHLEVDLVPKTSTGEGLLNELLGRDGSVENRMFLVIRPEAARDVVTEGLTKAGAIVDEAIAYRTVPETGDPAGARARFLEGSADVITFASSSSVENFLALALPLPPEIKIASIGPITSATLREHGLKIDAEAKTHDIPGLVDAVKNLFQNRGVTPVD
ncbi:MAG: uroporphyrinogen-III C-methyltransferase [Verrucomicrobiales bacterium]